VGTGPVQFPALLRYRGRGRYGCIARGVVTTVSIALQNRRLVKPPSSQTLWIVIHSDCGRLRVVLSDYKRTFVHAFERISGTYRLTDAARAKVAAHGRMPERGLESDIASTSSPPSSPISRKSCHSDCPSMSGSPSATSG